MMSDRPDFGIRLSSPTSAISPSRCCSSRTSDRFWAHGSYQATTKDERYSPKPAVRSWQVHRHLLLWRPSRAVVGHQDAARTTVAKASSLMAVGRCLRHAPRHAPPHLVPHRKPCRSKPYSKSSSGVLIPDASQAGAGPRARSTTRRLTHGLKKTAPHAVFLARAQGRAHGRLWLSCSCGASAPRAWRTPS